MVSYRPARDLRPRVAHKHHDCIAVHTSVNQVNYGGELGRLTIGRHVIGKISTEAWKMHEKLDGEHKGTCFMDSMTGYMNIVNRELFSNNNRLAHNFSLNYYHLINHKNLISLIGFPITFILFQSFNIYLINCKTRFLFHEWFFLSHIRKKWLPHVQKLFKWWMNQRWEKFCVSKTLIFSSAWKWLITGLNIILLMYKRHMFSIVLFVYQV